MKPREHTAVSSRLTRGLLVPAVAAGLTVATGAVAAPAQAGAPGDWSRISSANLRNIDGPSVLRLPTAQNRRLLVTWTDRTGSLESVRSRLVATNGRTASSVRPVAGGWVSVNQSTAPLLFGGKPAVAFGGIRSLDRGEVFDGGGALATSNNGASWALRGTPITPSQHAYGSYGLAALEYRNKPLLAFTRGSANHFSYSLGGKEFEGSPVTGANVYGVSLAKDPKTGAVWSAFLALGSATNKKSGIYVQRILPSKTPLKRAPGSVDRNGNVLLDLKPVALASRSKGGVYLAYPTGYPFGTGVRVWKVGTTSIKKFGAHDAGDVWLTRGPGGRLWVSWRDDTDDRIRAVRSNAAVTAWGARQSLKLPTRYGMFKTATEGSTGRLDLVALATTKSSAQALYHTQLRGGLSVGLSKARIRSATGGKILVVVRDAGLAVKGAKVSYAGHTYRTNSKGKVVVRVAKKTKKGTKTIVVKRSGYSTAKKTFKVV